MTIADPIVLVAGAGISGLAAAHELHRSGAKVIVAEADDRAGGKILTTPFAGLALDAGPDSFLARVPWGRELCEELGLADELVAPAQRSAYVYLDGELQRLPVGLVLGVPTDLDVLAESGLISPAGVARAAQDLEMADNRPDGDESVGSLIRRRLGDEVLERLVDPLLGGVNAGNSDDLSLEVGAAQLAAAAKHSPSLIRGLRAMRDANPTDPDAPVFHSVPGGIGRLVDRLIERLPAGAVRLGTRVVALQPLDDGNGRWRVQLDPGPPVDVDGIVLATPAPISGRLLADTAPGPGAALAEFDYASVVLVSLAYSIDDVGRPLDASGFLVPRTEGLLLTACSWASSKFEHLARPGTVVLRASAGRSDDQRAMTMDDTELLTRLRADLATTMGIEAEPTEVRISPWAESLPQFRPGHLDRVDAIEAALRADAPGVVLAGAAYRGVGLPSCIHQARTAARRLLTPDAGRDAS